MITPEIGTMAILLMISGFRFGPAVRLTGRSPPVKGRDRN